MTPHRRTNAAAGLFAAEAVAAVVAAQVPAPNVDAHLNSYVSDLPQGVYDHGTTLSVVGANGRRILVRDDVDGVWIGGVLVTDGAVLTALAHLLDGMADR